MKVYALRRKSTQEFLFPIILGEPYRCPEGEDPRDFEAVDILIPTTEAELRKLESSVIDVKLEKMARHLGMTAADLIEKAATAFGVPPCQGCQLRKRILYAVDRLGWWAAARMILKTVMGKSLNAKERGLVQGLWS